MFQVEKIKTETQNMGFLNECCCICMRNTDLKHLFDVDQNGLSHYNKLTSSVAEMDFTEMNDQRLICEECCVTLNTVYNFRQRCLRSKTNLITCYICMDNSDLKDIYDVDNDGVSHYHKLTSSVAEMNYKEMNNLICGKCCVTLDTVYNFRQTCLRSKTNLITYNSQLQTSSHVSGTTSDSINDIRPEILVKEEIFIKCENEDNSFEEHNPQREFKTEIYEEFPASVKEEPESEDDSSAHEDATADHLNEVTFGDVRVKVEPEMEEEPCIEFSTIDIKEDPLAVVKEEPLSDSETPQDGSTSLLYTYGEPKSEETSVGSEGIQKCLEKSIRCDVCKKNFADEKKLKVHMRIHTDDRPHACEICKKAFFIKRDLVRHMRTHSGERPYECEVCNKSFNLKGTLTTHMSLHSDDKPYGCGVCDKSFTHKRQRDIHMQVHSTVRPYECDVCNKTFKLKSILANHVRTHATVKPFPCDLCKKSFNHKGNLAKHKRIHAGLRPFECKICGKAFIEKQYGKKHIRTNHPDEDPHTNIVNINETSTRVKKEPMSDSETQDGSTSQARGTYGDRKDPDHKSRFFQCKVCEKCFSFKSDLTRHMLTHTGERPFECEICKKGFMHKSHYKRHFQLHSGERPHECEICKKTFIRKPELIAHFRTHTGEKPYVCDVCERRFTHKSSLIYHMQVHSGGKIFECEICQKAFDQKSALRDHMLIHSDEKTYPCELCQKSFRQKRNLTLHMKMHSNERPYQCEICKQTFRQNRSFKTHLKKHHGLESSQGFAGTENQNDKIKIESSDLSNDTNSTSNM